MRKPTVIVAFSLVTNCASIYADNQLDPTVDPAPQYQTGKIFDAPGAATPLANEKFNAFIPPKPGTMIQLGLFSRLEGAEKRQAELSNIGITPFVEKHISEGQVRYAVLIGPYRSPDELKKMETRLESQGVSYFKRPETRF